MSRIGVAARAALVSATLAFLLIPAPARAASGGWVANGPPGGGVQALAIGAGAPDRVWAGTVYSTYTEPKPGQASVSVNGGRTWRDVPGIRMQPIGSFAVDPTNPDVVYAGADCNQCSGVFKTADGGHHWDLTTLFRRFVKAIAIDPSNPPTLYVGTLIDGTFKSVDGGATWASADTGLGGNPVFSMVVDPFDGQTILAGTRNHGTYRSTDGGSHWAPARTGIGDQQVNALVADPTVPGRFFAGGAGGVYLTADGGDTWTLVSNGLDGHGVADLVMAAGDPQTIYAGSAKNGGWRSTDGAQTWVPFGPSLEGKSVKAVAVDPTDDEVVYAGTEKGVEKSLDGGRTWQLRTRGLSNSDVWGLGIGGSGDGVLYAGERSELGVLRSGDGGVTWHHAAAGLPADAFVMSIAVDPTDTETAYAAMSQGVFKTVDGGQSWVRLHDSTIRADMVRVAPSDALRIYADGNGPVSGKDLFRSDDGGATWTDISRGVIGGYGSIDVAIDPADPDHLYALAGLVYESHDGGGSWTLASNGIPTGRYVHGLAMDRFDPTLLYTIVNEDLYRTSDGTNWVPVDMTGCTGVTSGLGLATDPAHPGVVYVTTSQGACRGAHGGRAWTTLPDIAPYYFGEVIAVAPDGNAVYVATRGGGVVRYPAP